MDQSLLMVVRSHEGLRGYVAAARGAAEWLAVLLGTGAGLGRVRPAGFGLVEPLVEWCLAGGRQTG